jgi:Arc-like DNA binding domain
MARKKRQPAQIKIRLPEALRRSLEREADKNGRTLNGEIVHRLTQPFVEADREALIETAVGRALAKQRAAEKAGAAAAQADFEEDLTKKEDDNGKAS